MSQIPSSWVLWEFLIWEGEFGFRLIAYICKRSKEEQEQDIRW